MDFFSRRLVVSVFVTFLFLYSVFLFKNQALADVNCDGTVSPSEYPSSNTGTVVAHVNNLDPGATDLHWVRVTINEPILTINSGELSGWTATKDSEQQITFSGGTITGGTTSDFSINVSSVSGDQPATAVTILSSESSDGSSAVQCHASPSISVVGDSTAPSISNVAISASATTAVISWSTDESASSIVNYGTTDNYGSSESSTTLTTSHNITLSNLTPTTEYHLQLQSADLAGNTVQSSDATFTTSATSTVTNTVTTTVTNTVTNTETKTQEKKVEVVITPEPDRKPPKIKLKTDFSEIQTQAPEIEGQASDEEGLQSVEYSVNDGRDWFFVEPRFANGEKKVDFSFTPLGLFDGKYLIKVRATDIHGNIQYTKPESLLIDRLPPALGGSVMSLGPQLLYPSSRGVYYTIRGLHPTITFSAIGGVTTATLYTNELHVEMNKMVGMGLWSTPVSFDNTGLYSLRSVVTDEAGNQTQQELGSLQVLDNGRVMSGGKLIQHAKVSLYTLQDQLKEFVLWDAQPFQQTNPQITSEDGAYAFLLPAGTYYMVIEAPGYRVFRSDIFTLKDSTTPLVAQIQLESKTGWQSKYLSYAIPDFRQTTASLQFLHSKDGESKTDQRIGQEFPYFELDSTTGRLTLDQLKGKPTVITFLSTWAPQGAAQLQILDTLRQQNAANIIVVMIHENLSAVSVFAQRGEYSVPMVADPDGKLVQQLSTMSLPTHYFLNSRGSIQLIKSGVLSADEIQDEMVTMDN